MEMTVKDIMQPPVASARTCDENITLIEAARMMREYNVSRLLVTKDDKPLGLVTLRAILQSPVDVQTRNSVIHALAWPDDPSKPTLH
jgi:predicted transcriptional regulator